jgi:hypothetical protein
MEVLGQKIVERADGVLKNAFPGAIIEWDPISPHEKVSGWIIWDGFGDLDEIDRQLLVSKALKAGLQPDEWKSISAVFAITANELAVIHENES